jgi:hypothetical protein
LYLTFQKVGVEKSFLQIENKKTPYGVVCFLLDCAAGNSQENKVLVPAGVSVHGVVFAVMLGGF